MTRKDAVKFMREAARYFQNRPTGGEDAVHWSNVYNAENCIKIANMLEADGGQWRFCKISYGWGKCTIGTTCALVATF